MVLGHRKRLSLMASIATKALPVNSRTRLQYLLDEGDALFFARNPDEHQRIRFHFKGEQIDGAGEASRYVRVTRDVAGRLVRQFAAADEAVAS